MIGIRVDANTTIASGHVMRSLSVARKLREMGQDVLFICADNNAMQYISGSGFEVYIMHTDWKDYDGEIRIIESIIKEYDVKSLLVDSYYITPKYMQYISKIVKVTYFDELHICGYGCQQLINGLLEPPKYTNSNQKAFIGPKYVALRDEFIQPPKKNVKEIIDNLLITSGGTDNYHFSKIFLADFLSREKWNRINISLVIGNLCVDKDDLVKEYGNNPRVRLYINTNRMAELMKEADYALTAGGTTLYEICATGLPACSYVVGDNQIEITHSFDKRGLIAFAGDFRKDPNETIDRIYYSMDKADYCFRKNLSLKLQEVVDGRGAERIARVLM